MNSQAKKEFIEFFEAVLTQFNSGIGKQYKEYVASQNEIIPSIILDEVVEILPDGEPQMGISTEKLPNVEVWSFDDYFLSKANLVCNQLDTWLKMLPTEQQLLEATVLRNQMNYYLKALEHSKITVIRKESSTKKDITADTYLYPSLELIEDKPLAEITVSVYLKEHYPVIGQLISAILMGLEMYLGPEISQPHGVTLQNFSFNIGIAPSITNKATESQEVTTVQNTVVTTEKLKDKKAIYVPKTLKGIEDYKTYNAYCENIKKEQSLLTVDAVKATAKEFKVVEKTIERANAYCDSDEFKSISQE